jgi:hypothetical protein
MRAILALLFVAMLAGCLSGDKDDPRPDPTPEPAYVLDCSISHPVGAWLEPCLAFASPNESPAKTEIDIAVNPTNPLNVVVASKDLDPNASDCVWAVAQVTHDGGHTWKTVTIGGNKSDRQPGDVLYGWDCITDPIMTFNKDGVLFYNLQVYALTGSKNIPGLPPFGLKPEGGMQVLAISRDGGDTFSELIVQHAGDELAVFHDYMRIGQNPATGTVYTIWNQLTAAVSSQPTLVAYRGGPTAGAPVYFPTPGRLSLGESGVVAGNDGTVYVCLCGFNSGGNAYFTSSTDDGQTFATPTKKFEFKSLRGLEGAAWRVLTVVELAIDNSGGPRDGCLYAVWAGPEDGAVGPSDVYMRSSCDRGATWSEPVVINADLDAQVFPRVAVDGRGTVHVVYLTRAHDPEHRLLDAEWSYSMDGQNWTTKRLTSISFDGDLGIHQNGFPFIGDYIGISAAGDDVYMGFPTTHTGRAEIAVAHVRAAPSE